MRIPSGMLEHTVQARRVTGVTDEGTQYSAPLDVACQYSETAKLRVDERKDSDTYGQPIVMAAWIITQLEDYLPVGTLVTTPFGDTVQIANAARYPHSKAPENAEMWGV